MFAPFCLNRTVPSVVGACLSRVVLLLAFLYVLALSSQVQGATEEDEVSAVTVYEEQIKPLLKTRCFSCHGALQQEAGLRLDTVAGMLRGGDSGAAIEPGERGASLLYQRVATDDVDERMPPEHEGESFSAEQLALVGGWIEAGASGPEGEEPESDPKDHWAFQPILRPEIPTEGLAGEVTHPIDAFLAGGYEQQGLVPQREASRAIQARRLYLDLIGVPPTLAELEAFLADETPAGYDALVERLLNDPRHGQRWARHWMDIWRYSDWWGLGNQLRNSQPHIWHWRDWIVDSLNEDLAYDEMIRQMLAGDELYPAEPDKLRATGYLARNWFLFNRHQWLDETVEHVSKGFLGLTMNCAKCHDHKYDAINQTDYYRMRAFFEPYHVRMDKVSGETDLSKDGIPRAFDGLLDQPTYRFVRGDENNPDESRVIEPGVPRLLSFASLEIAPVELPREAWQPGWRMPILQAHHDEAVVRLESARGGVKQREQELAERQSQLAQVEARVAEEEVSGEASAGGLIEFAAVEDDFATFLEERWELFGGEWEVESGKVVQRRDGATRAALRLKSTVPRDFEATMKFRIVGGSQWRSVGIAFDADARDPSQPIDPEGTEQHVYVSAYASGSKIQASFLSQGKWTYPTGSGVHPQPIELGRSYTLRLQVRDTLVNAYLDDELVIAWRTPLPRRDGVLQLTTFDALAEFEGFSFRALAPDVELQEAEGGDAKPADPLAAARHEVALAEAAIEAARAKVLEAEAEVAYLDDLLAFRSEGSEFPEGLDDGELSDLESAALRSEQRLEVARLHRAVCEARVEVLKASGEERGKAEKKVAELSDKLAGAEALCESPLGSELRLVPPSGARWAATRFNSSLADDPQVEFPPTSSGRRTALAEWITSRENPLTARVAVNHVWARHFGRPLVPTVFDFGRNGAEPTHPELLDWLAAELIEHDWSLKHLHRLIVTSAAYRMDSSRLDAETNLERDGDNRYWWRREPIRMESQVVRDTLLALAGKLDVTAGGPPVPSSEQADSVRRSLYFFHSNNERNLFLETFDEALVTDCYRREQSIVPQQALAMTNSQLVLDSAGPISESLAAVSQDDRAFIENAFLLLLGIEASEAEVGATQAAWNRLRELPDASEADARRQLVWALLNHNDFVTLR